MSDNRERPSQLTLICAGLCIGTPVIALAVGGYYSAAGFGSLLVWWLLRRNSWIKYPWWYYLIMGFVVVGWIATWTSGHRMSPTIIFALLVGQNFALLAGQLHEKRRIKRGEQLAFQQKAPALLRRP